MASTPSSVPNIIVHPPQDEGGLPWLCFDANEPFNSDFLPELEQDSVDPSQLGLYNDDDFNDDGNYYQQNPYPIPSSHSGVIHGESTRSIVDVLLSEASQDDEGTHNGSDTQEPGNDSEVVEVIKVRRSAEPVEPQRQQVTSTPKTSSNSNSSSGGSKFFAKALRSVKSFGKKSKKEKAASSSEQYSRSRTLSSFSQLSASSSVSSLRTDADGDRTILASDFGRSPSPSPSNISARTTQSSRKFSVLGLSRLFSFASQTSLQQHPLPPSSPPELVDSRDSLGPGTNPSTSSSSSSLHTPMSSVLTLPAVVDTKPSIEAPTSVLEIEDPDVSMEMQLDSLHFDSISFDANEFR